MTGYDDIQIAELLCNADYVLDRCHTSLIAFCDRRYIEGVGRECSRIDGVRKVIAAALEHLPEREPLTPEREARLGAFLGAVLDKRFGDGTDEGVAAAFDALNEEGA